MRIGYGMKRRRRRIVKAALPLIGPSAAWTGVAGSGFTIAPADPVRTTAKPVLRLIVPPFQWYTNDVLVGVYAAANNGGSLFDNMGIEKIIAHFEGSRVSIEKPTVEVITDANGNQRSYFGWWLKLRNDGRSGHARLYFEAVPKDVTMQRRVIGPYQFSPQGTSFSQEVTVAASLPQITGSRYQTFAGALNYLKSINATNPRITFTEAGSYVLDGATNGWSNGSWVNGYVHVEAAVPVSLVRPVPAANADPSSFRPSCSLHLKGNKITLDFANALEFLSSDTAARDHWLDGINITTTKGRYSLYRKTLQSGLGWLLRQSAAYLGAWVAECHISYVANALLNTSLARGNTIQSTWSDLFTHSQCVIANQVDDHDSTEYMARINALSVTYTGAGSTATLERTSNVFTARVNGTSVGTFALDWTLAGYNAGTNYTVANLVNWLNSLAGWSATLLDDSRAAGLIAAPGQIPGNFAAQNVKATTLTLQTWVDVHADWWQRQDSPVTMENVVLVDNIATNFVGQAVFWGQMDDGIMANNAWHHKDGVGAGGIDAGLATSRSQVAGTQRHVIHVHNTNTGQRFLWRTGSTGLFNPDSYSLFANNVFPSFEWFSTTDPDLVPQDNHMFDGYPLPPSGVSGMTQGGSAATLFADPLNGDFAPRGALLSNSKTARLPVDLHGNRRGQASPVGASA